MIRVESIQAILFDLDGTLVDTDDAAVERLARRLRLLGYLSRKHTPRSLARWLTMQAETPGNTILTLLDMVGLDPAVENAGHWVRTRLSRQKDGGQRTHHFRPIEGVPDMLAHLSGRYKLALVTSRGEKDIQAFRKAQPELTSRLEVLVGRHDTRRMKPHAAPVLKAADKLEVPIQRCLMVGDTPVDIKSARRAGAASVAVLCGFGQHKELLRAGADLILGSTAELLTLL